MGQRSDEFKQTDYNEFWKQTDFTPEEIARVGEAIRFRRPSGAVVR
jgi:hypothetical protein